MSADIQVSGGSLSRPAPANLTPNRDYTTSTPGLAERLDRFAGKPKYAMDDDIALLKAVISTLAEDLERNTWDRKLDGMSRREALRSIGELQKILREHLALSAQLEALVSVERVKQWTVNVVRIVQEEVNEPERIARICQRIMQEKV